MEQYTWFKIKKFISKAANDRLGKTLITEDEIVMPPDEIKADIAVPIFKVVKILKISATEVLDKFKNIQDENPLLKKVELQKSGFINFFINWEKASELIFEEFKIKKDDYGKLEIGEGKTIVVDYSSPNIAKPFNIGHLRSTIIGQAIVNIYKYLGYEVIGDNHLGDWGTQFGKLITAYKKWGSQEKVEKRLIAELVDLYLKFHQFIEENPGDKQRMEDEARGWFKKLETGNREATELWKWFVDISVKEFQRTYELLGIDFDYYLGESFYNEMLPEIVAETLAKGIASWDEMQESGKEEIVKDQVKEKEKVILVKLDEFGINVPLLIQKNDGTSLYATRDIAAAKFRINKFEPEKILYVVGGEQQLYFKQVFKTLDLLGYNSDFVHIWFGLVSLPDGKMSTRKGRFIYLEDVLNEAIKKASIIIKERDLDDVEIEEISKIIGIGAVKYADLSQKRTKNIVFNWDKMLNIKGNSGPYIQYVAVRINSILNQLDINFENFDLSVKPYLLTEEIEQKLLKKIFIFPQIVKDAAQTYEPHRIASFLFDLSQVFNGFYQSISVLKSASSDLKNTRAFLIKMVEIVIRKGLNLLGIEVPPKM